MDVFPFERLESYHLSRMQARLCSGVLRSLPRDCAAARGLSNHFWRPGLAIARGSAELTRGHAVRALCDAREHTRMVLRYARSLRTRRAGDQARLTALIEIAERLRARLAEDIEEAEAGIIEPWCDLPA